MHAVELTRGRVARRLVLFKGERAHRAHGEHKITWFEMPATAGLPQGGEIKSEACCRGGSTLHGHIDCAPAGRDVMRGTDRPTLRRRLALPPWRRCPWAEARSTLHDRRGRPSRAAYAAPLKATRCGATHPDSRGGASPLLVAEPLPVSESTTRLELTRARRAPTAMALRTVNVSARPRARHRHCGLGRGHAAAGIVAMIHEPPFFQTRSVWKASEPGVPHRKTAD